jgi:nickel superoxide dismutase
LAAHLSVRIAGAHCQVPCGVFTDNLRILTVKEDCQTIAKAMQKIAGGETNQNQVVRWIMTKEDHAGKIQEVVTQYFMAQRIKPDAPKDPEKLQALHAILLSATKCKQVTDTAAVDKLLEQVNQFVDLYFTAEEAKHIKEH